MAEARGASRSSQSRRMAAKGTDKADEFAVGTSVTRLPIDTLPVVSVMG